jgi:hypothetical protein
MLHLEALLYRRLFRYRRLVCWLRRARDASDRRDAADA